MTLLEVRRLGRTRYAEAHALQQRLVEQRLVGEVGDLLLLTEHEPVITVGRGTPAEEQRALGTTGLEVVEVERGGEATYHGPGQLIAYPLLLLPEGRRDLHRYLRDLEEVVIGVLSEFELEGARRPGLTGVWLGEKKVCSLGVAVRRWVTWHGLALNLHTDLAPFRRFHPCGLASDVMTRVADHAELAPTNLLGEVLFVKHFCRVFARELPPSAPLAEPGPPGAGPGFRPLPVL
ncbi:MAG: lipoyl(octanoyl) transferase LipB [Planctomycetota bacterium]